MIGLIARSYGFSSIAADGNSPFQAAFPVANLINNYYGLVGRSQSALAGQNIVVYVDLGAALYTNVLGLLWHNMRATDTIRWQAYTDNTYQTQLYDSGTLSAVTGQTQREVLVLWKHLKTLSTAVTARYWKVTLVSQTTANPAGFIQASRLIIGRAASFAIGPQKATLTAIDRNAVVTSEIGDDFSQEDPTLIRPVAALSLSYAKQSEMEAVLGFYTLSLGISRPMLVCTDLTSLNTQDNLVFGRVQDMLQYDSDTYDVWSLTATVTSLGV